MTEPNEPEIGTVVRAIADPHAPLPVTIADEELRHVHEWITNHASFLAAWEHALQAVDDRAPLTDALKECFPHLVKGFAAHRAVVLVPDAHGELQILAFTTSLRDRQLNAIQHGISVRGVSSSIIRKVLDSKEAAIIQHPTLLKEGDRTGALADYDYSVLCAPVLDPSRERVQAVLYLQSRGGPVNAYRDDDLRFLMKFISLLERLLDLRDRLLAAIYPPDQPLDVLEKKFRRDIIEDRLRRHAHDPAATAASLGIHHISIYRLLRELGLPTRSALLEDLGQQEPGDDEPKNDREG